MAEVPVEAIPEVLDFLNAQENLESFKAKNKKLMNDLANLAEQYNQSLEAADKAVRQRKVDCGPFKQLSPQVKVHAEKLYSAIGRAEFLKIGGVVGSQPTYSLDKKTLDAAVARGDIPEALVPVVKEIIAKYSAIPKMVLP